MNRFSATYVFEMILGFYGFRAVRLKLTWDSVLSKGDTVSTAWGLVTLKGPIYTDVNSNGCVDARVTSVLQR